jgi:CBS domain-containing protein
MNVTIKDLMSPSVVTTQPHKSVGHVKEIMLRNKVHSVPVVNAEMELQGIITTKDLIGHSSDNTPVSHLMTKDVYTVPLYSGIHIAARIMRNHHINHLVVTDEQRVVGLLSSFDLLELVEDHRFVLKNGPTPNSKKAKRD